MRVFVCRPLTPGATALLEASGHDVTTHPDPVSPPPRDEVLAGIAGSSGVVSTLTERIDAEALDVAGASLRVVANVAVGVDNVDVAEAARRGVVVTNTPDVLTDATADLTFGLIVAACRRVVEGDRLLRSGTRWEWSVDFLVGRPVTGATLGIVGYGRIGQAVARRAQAFGMTVLATGRSFLAAHAVADGVAPTPLHELLGAADIVTLHVPLTAETRHLIGAAELAMMGPGSVLVNMARGGVVDEAALVEALGAGRIGAAALDVFEREPDPHPGLLGLPNVVLTPHLGSADTVTREHMCTLAVRNLLAVLDGTPPLTRVVPP